jgi:hypothetical protein
MYNSIHSMHAGVYIVKPTMPLIPVRILEKPPIDIMPRWRWEELYPHWDNSIAAQRIILLNMASSRYEEAKVAVPEEWEKERTELLERLTNEARWYCDPTGILNSFIFAPIFLGIQSKRP